MSSISNALPGATPIQQVAAGLTFTATNASICALTGHLFSFAPAASAFFGVSASVLGLGIASYYAFGNDQEDLMDRVSKVVVSFFAGGALGYLLTNALGLTISAPACLLLLMGPVSSTTLGLLALKIATTYHPNIFADAVQVAGDVGEYLGL